MSEPRSHNIFLTGATGLLGHYLLADLLRAPHTRCFVLLRPPLEDGVEKLIRLLNEIGGAPEAWIARERLIPIEGSLPGNIAGLGIEGIDQIVHAAANTGFDAEASGEPFRTNVQGTNCLLELADQLGVRDFTYVSTAFVCGVQTGSAAHAVPECRPQFTNAYEQSKWEAEQLVAAWAKDSRTATICRPSILFGDRKTGRTTNFGGAYVLIRAMEVLARAVADDADIDRHRVPLKIPGDPDATLNLVPVCWAASRISEIVLDVALHGRVHHVTNPNPPTHADIKRWFEEYFDLGGGEFTSQSWPWADPSRFEEAFNAVGERVMDYFRNDRKFDSSMGGGQSLIDRDYFLKCIRYAVQTRWGRETRRIDSDTTAVAFPDPAWYFEEHMKEHLPQSIAARVDALSTIVRFSVGGAGGGQWVCHFDKGQLVELHRGADGMAEEFGYHIDRAVFSDIVRGRKSIQSAFFLGQAEMTGNLLLALKMVPIIESFVREFAV